MLMLRTNNVGPACMHADNATNHHPADADDVTNNQLEDSLNASNDQLADMLIIPPTANLLVLIQLPTTSH